jgi:hypothetical protein
LIRNPKPENEPVIISGLDVASSAVKSVELEEFVAVVVAENRAKSVRDLLVAGLPVVEVGKPEIGPVIIVSKTKINFFCR